MTLIKNGNAISLDGASQYAGRAVVSTVTNNFSVVLWANVTSYSNTPKLFENGINDANGFELGITSAGVFDIDFSFVANLSSGYTISTGVWYQFAAIRNGGTTQLYVNASAQGGTSASAPNTPGTTMNIGCSRTSGGVVSSYFNGLIDDVRLYERAITTAELTQLYNRAINTTAYGDISSTNLKQWFKLDESSGILCIDSSVTNLSMTTVGTPTFVDGKVELGRETKTITNVLRPSIFSPGIGR